VRIVPLIILVSIAVGAAFGQKQTANEPLRIVITVDSPILKSGTTVFVKGQLTNTTDQPFAPSGCYCGPPGVFTYLAWEVRDEKGQAIAERMYPRAKTFSPNMVRILKPGESMVDMEDIARRFDLTRPGTYVIQASKQVSNEKDSPIVKSNKLSVTIMGSRLGNDMSTPD
jgi:hypothetical protein